MRRLTVNEVTEQPRGKCTLLIAYVTCPLNIASISLGAIPLGTAPRHATPRNGITPRNFMLLPYAHGSSG